MSAMDIADFLAARYDEGEAQVNDRACIHCGIPTCELRHDLGVYDYTHGTSLDWDGWQGRRCPGRITGAEPVQNPKGRLADIKLKRAILARYQTACRQADVAKVNGDAAEAAAWEKIAGALELCTRDLGTEFDQQPGYKEAWKP